jgi:hypothetical protein
MPLEEDAEVFSASVDLSLNAASDTIVLMHLPVDVLCERVSVDHKVITRCGNRGSKFRRTEDYQLVVQGKRCWLRPKAANSNTGSAICDHSSRKESKSYIYLDAWLFCSS